MLNHQITLQLFHNPHISVFQPGLNSDIVTVGSDIGPASREHPSKMGVYNRTEDFNNNPMWANDDNSQKIFYGPGKVG